MRFGVGSERPFTKNVNQKYVLPPKHEQQQRRKRM